MPPRKPNPMLAQIEARHEREIWYAKDKLDAALQAVCGDYFVPWEERYL